MFLAEKGLGIPTRMLGRGTSPATQSIMPQATALLARQFDFLIFDLGRARLLGISVLKCLRSLDSGADSRT
ncbi:MAG: hypothetical protein WAO76_01930 [Georgfuchsia sp.]